VLLDVLVNLSEHLEVGVPHQFLDRHQVDTTEDGIRCKRVPDGVGTDVEVDLPPQPTTTAHNCPMFPGLSSAVAEEGSFWIGLGRPAADLKGHVVEQDGPPAASLRELAWELPASILPVDPLGLDCNSLCNFDLGRRQMMVHFARQARGHWFEPSIAHS
jgi:hypothetical protein